MWKRITDGIRRMASRGSSRGAVVKSLTGRPATRGYQPAGFHRWGLYPKELPVFSFLSVTQMMLDPTVRLGLAMREAPIHGLEFAWKNGDQWESGIRAGKEEVGKFVQRQLERIWRNDLHAVLQAQVWGWSAGEVTFRMTRAGTVEVDRLLPRHANDVRARARDSELVGVRFLRCQGQGHAGVIDLGFPKCWFHGYLPESGLMYGLSVLLGAYSPWFDKWMDGGALDVRRLFMHKDAYAGADITYPEGVQYIEGKGEVPNRDIAREIVEQITAGGVTARPAQAGPNGEELWKLTRGQPSANPGHILQYPKDLDVEILRGMEIADDVISVGMESTGSWAGKRVPMAAFYSGLDRWAASVIRDLDDQIIRPAVRLNYGRDEEYQIQHKPLAEQAMEQQGQGQQDQPGDQAGGFGGLFGGGGDDQGGPQPGGPQPGQRMSLDGRAARIVAAAQRVIRMRAEPDEAGKLKARIDSLKKAGKFKEAGAAMAQLDELNERRGSNGGGGGGNGRSDGGGKSGGSGGRWITIGGRKEGDKEHAGGFPIQIDENGMILKSGGPKGLVGKHIGKVYTHFKRMRNTPAAKQKRYQSTVTKQARKWEISVEQYERIADEVHKEKTQLHAAREGAKARARRLLGIDAGDVRRWENQGLDFSSKKLSKYGWDEVGRTLASDVPELGWEVPDWEGGADTGDWDAQLWDLLREGKVDPPNRQSEEFHAEVDDYLQYLADQYGEPEPGHADDASFDFGANVDDEEAYRFGLDVLRLARQRMLFDDAAKGSGTQGRLFDQGKGDKGDSNPWKPYKGPRGGSGWKHAETGDIRYQTERPGANETGGGSERRKQSGKKQEEKKKDAKPQLSHYARRSLEKILEAEEIETALEKGIDAILNSFLTIGYLIQSSPEGFRELHNATTADWPLEKKVAHIEGHIWKDKVEHCCWWGADGKMIGCKAGKESQIAFEPEEVAKMKAAVFTHNHPSGLRYARDDPRSVGTSFSNEDLVMAARAQLREVRAVSPAYIHIASAPDGGWPADYQDMVYVVQQAENGVRKRWQTRIDAQSAIDRAKAEETCKIASAEHAHNVCTTLAERGFLTYERRARNG